MHLERLEKVYEVKDLREAVRLRQLVWGVGARSIAVDEGDEYLAAVTADLGEAASSSVRIYHIGRRPAQVRFLVTCAQTGM